MNLAEARAFLASLPQKDGRYLAMMVDGAEALENTADVAEAMVAALKRVADAMEFLKAAEVPLP
jgi:hypothetical protein